MNVSGPLYMGLDGDKRVARILPYIFERDVPDDCKQYYYREADGWYYRSKDGTDALIAHLRATGRANMVEGK